MSDLPQSVSGNRIDQTLAGESRLEIGEVISEAWQLTSGVKLLLFGGIVFVLASMIIVSVLATVFGLDYLQGGGSQITQLIATILLYPFLTGVLMIGLKHSVGMPVSANEFLAHYGSILTIAAVGVLQSLAIGVGMVLLILPGLYLSVALSLAIPLHVEKQLGIIDSLVTSLKLINKHFLTVLLLLILAAVVLMASIVTIIGLIWSIPWMIMVFSIIYRQLAGIEFADRPQG